MRQQQQNKAPTPSEAGPCRSDGAPFPVPQSTSCSGGLGSALRAQNVQFRLSNVKGAASSLLSAKPWLVHVTTTRTSLQLGSGGTRLTLGEKHWFLGRPPRHGLGGPKGRYLPAGASCSATLPVRSLGEKEAVPPPTRICRARPSSCSRGESEAGPVPQDGRANPAGGGGEPGPAGPWRCCPGDLDL